MVTIRSIQQDARRKIGHTMEVDGVFGELQRLVERITDGRLAPEEIDRETAELDEVWDRADLLLRKHGMDWHADRLEEEVHRAMNVAAKDMRRKAGPHEPRYTEYGEFGPL